MHAYGYTYDQVFSHTIAHYLMTCSLAKVLASLKSLKYPKLLHHYSFTFLGALRPMATILSIPTPTMRGPGSWGLRGSCQQERLATDIKKVLFPMYI